MTHDDVKDALLKGCADHLSKIVDNIVGDICDDCKTTSLEGGVEHFANGLRHTLSFYAAAMIEVDRQCKE